MLKIEKRTFSNANSCLNTNIYSYLETSGGQSSYLYLNVVHFFHTCNNETYVKLKTVVFMHLCLICPLLLKVPYNHNYYDAKFVKKYCIGHCLDIQQTFPEVDNPIKLSLG